MNCPLCLGPLKQHLLLTSQAIVSCSNEQCIYPFNLPPEELRRARLIVATDEAEILQKMKTKLQHAGVEEKVTEFMVREDR